MSVDRTTGFRVSEELYIRLVKQAGKETQASGRIITVSDVLRFAALEYLERN